MVVLKSYEIYHYTVKYVSDRYSTQLQASCSSHAIPACTLMFLNRNRLHHALSSFNHVTHRWAAIPLHNPHDSITQRPSSHPADAIGKQSLCLTSWNIQTWPITCSKLILNHILKGPKFSDIIHLQQVTSSA